MFPKSYAHFQSRLDARRRASCPEPTFFQPNQLAFLVTHKGQGDLTQEQVNGLLRWGEKVAEGQVRLTNPRTKSFPALSLPETKYLLAAAPCKRPMLEQRDAFTLIFADVQNVKNSSALVELILSLDKYQGQEPVPELTLKLVSPNWLTSGASHVPGTGGPGSWPVPYQGDLSRQRHEFTGWPAKLAPDIEERKGKDVTVAILDTAPCLHDIAEAYHNSHYAAIQHPLIEKLLGPDSPLEVHHAPSEGLLSYEDVLRLAGIELNENPYRMTDHGLFVAGIIHTIAPQAELHLVEVLNPYGVGDLESITTGLAWVFHNFAGKPLVVNCSLVFSVPLEEGHYPDGFGGQLEQRRSNTLEWLAHNGWPLAWICDLIFAGGGRVIAAAGNDRLPTDATPPQARYPAALQSVLGVGAVRKYRAGDTQPMAASYSNVSDLPSTDPKEMGITTLGGEPGENEGVLGLYIGEFPDGSPNDTGWAWWAGTSFATPVISGATAAMLSHLRASGPAPTTQDAIEALHDPAAIRVTDKNEHALVVKQG